MKKSVFFLIAVALIFGACKETDPISPGDSDGIHLDDSGAGVDGEESQWDADSFTFTIHIPYVPNFGNIVNNTLTLSPVLTFGNNVTGIQPPSGTPRKFTFDGLESEPLAYDITLKNGETLQAFVKIIIDPELFDVIPPGPVTNLSGTINGLSVELAWTNPVENDFAKVAITWLPETASVQPVEVTGTNYTVPDLQDDTTYHFTVTTYDTANNSGEAVTIEKTLGTPNTTGVTGGKVLFKENGDGTTDVIHIFNKVAEDFLHVPDGMTLNAKVLVVAGGGSAGGGNHSYDGFRNAGGGGAGGVIYNENVSINAGNTRVVVGNAGWQHAVGAQGGNGGNSVFGALTAIGGGGGGGGYKYSNRAGRNGGSGGGGGATSGSDTGGAGGLGTTGQGYSGSKAANSSSTGDFAGGGGGGATGPGTAGSGITPGLGGPGFTSTIASPTDEPYTYSSGGNGGNKTGIGSGYGTRGGHYGDGGNAYGQFGSWADQGIVVVRWVWTH